MSWKKTTNDLKSVPPKKFTCPHHFHGSDEKHFLVLSGKAILKQHNQYKEVSTGDLVRFENNGKGTYQFYNPADHDFKYLTLSTKDALDICRYPNSNRFFARKIDKFPENHSSFQYFANLNNPDKYWNIEYLKHQ